MKLGIDASNIGLGGGITHLKEILQHFILYPEIDSIVLFASQKVLDQLPNSDNIKKKSFPFLNKGLFSRVLFQLFVYDRYIYKYCDIFFSVTGDYLGNFKPLIGMSRNMLLYERDIWKEIKQPKEIIRFWLNYIKQKKCFKNSDGIIFISQYAKDFISGKINLHNKKCVVINHGVSPRFKEKKRIQLSIENYNSNNLFKLLYVSTVHIYKNQWNVVEAIAKLRKKGLPVQLDLVGGIIFEPAGKLLRESIKIADPDGQFIFYHGNIPYDEIDSFYKNADGIIFASTCENMPNILIESMASGLPIACSDKEPMPEFLKENGFYFNAKSVFSIEETIENMLTNLSKREITANNNLNEIDSYTWQNTSLKTFKFLKEIYISYYGNKE